MHFKGLVLVFCKSFVCLFASKNSFGFSDFHFMTLYMKSKESNVKQLDNYIYFSLALLSSHVFHVKVGYVQYVVTFVCFCGRRSKAMIDILFILTFCKVKLKIAKDMCTHVVLCTFLICVKL